jgi:hypothetical protein
LQARQLPHLPGKEVFRQLSVILLFLEGLDLFSGPVLTLLSSNNKLVYKSFVFDYLVVVNRKIIIASRHSIGMNEIDVYRKNELYFDSGIDADIDKSPYDMNKKELKLLERRLIQLSEEKGEPYVFVEWGQPFGGPISGHKYHPKEDIEKLVAAYEQHNLRGICPKAGFIVDSAWISNYRVLLEEVKNEKPREFDFEKYLKFAENFQL